MTTASALVSPVVSGAGSRAGFATTHWSVVLAARADTPARAEVALETLCRAYWPPLYAYARRQGRTPHDAQDLTQEFFARLLAHDTIGAAAPDKGRFRSFLLVVFKRFLVNEWEAARAQKRGGGALHVPLDAMVAETGYQAFAAPGESADKAYERHWAMTLLNRAMARLREEFTASGKESDFEILKHRLTAATGPIDAAAEATALGVSPGAARVAVHRLRRRYREVFREEIAHTVAHEGEIDDEIRRLLAALAD